MDNLATLFDLTDAQKVQVQAILQEEHAKMKEAFEQARSSGTQARLAADEGAASSRSSRRRCRS